MLARVTTAGLQGRDSMAKGGTLVAAGVRYRSCSAGLARMARTARSWRRNRATSTATERCDADALILVPAMQASARQRSKGTRARRFTEVVEAPLQVLDRRFRIGVRGEEIVKGAILRDELQHHVGVLDGRLDLAPVADHSWVLLDLSTCSGLRSAMYPGRSVKHLHEPRPLVLDDLPVQPRAKNRLRQLLEVGTRVARVGPSDLG